MITKKQIKIICLIIYFILVVGTEFLYRKPFFNFSLEIQRRWYDTFVIRKEAIQISSAILYYASALFTILIFIFLPLSQFFSYFSLIMFDIIVFAIIVIVYADYRPCLVDKSIEIEKGTSYGNPSGHTVFCITTYLAIWDVLVNTDKFNKIFDKKANVIKYLLLPIFILIIIYLSLSRAFLNSHSFNQILYGDLMGFGIYYLFYHILETQKIKDGKIFFEHISNLKNVIIYGLVYISYFIALYLIKFYRKDWNLIGFDLSLMFTVGVGFHCGLLLLLCYDNDIKKTKSNEMNNWNDVNLLKRLYLLLLLCPIGLFELYNLFLNKYELIELLILSSVFQFLIGFYTGFCYFIILIKLRLINNKFFEPISAENEETLAILNAVD